MTKQSSAFLKDLKILCQIHGVEVCRGSRFWIFGRYRKQCERFGIVDHLEPSLNKEMEAGLKRLGIKKGYLEVVDLSKTLSRPEVSMEGKLLKPDGKPIIVKI